MHKFLLYIKFLWKSTNQHGVQSPFVYELVTGCFYNRSMRKKNSVTTLVVKDKKLSRKQIKFVNRLINYFKINQDNTDEFNLIYFDSPNQFNINEIKTILSTNQIVLINSINNSKKQNEAWESIIKHPLTTVTIDIYFFGLVFLRKEQAKEHFIIRP